MSARAWLACIALAAGMWLGGCSGVGHRQTRFTDDPGVTLDAAEPIAASETMESPPFDEAVLSWDIELGEGASAVLDASVRSGGVWSGWLRVARRGTAVCEEPTREDGVARIDVDTVVCRSPGDAIRWRVVACGGPVRVRSVWVTTTGIGRGGRVVTPGGLEPVVHAVPHKAQREAGDELGGRLCSPTSVAMVVESRGVRVGVGEMAARVYDADFDLYGNWVNNTLGASEMGVPMRLTRIASWDEARSFLENGPMVISLRPFDEGELAGAGYSSESGHLIVVAGLDGRGGAMVRDPAHADDSRRRYRMTQLTRLWLIGNKGTAYVLDAD